MVSGACTKCKLGEESWYSFTRGCTRFSSPMQYMFTESTGLFRYKSIPLTASNGAKSPPIMSNPIFIFSKQMVLNYKVTLSMELFLLPIFPYRTIYLRLHAHGGEHEFLQ